MVIMSGEPPRSHDLDSTASMAMRSGCPKWSGEGRVPALVVSRRAFSALTSLDSSNLFCMRCGLLWFTRASGPLKAGPPDSSSDGDVVGVAKVKV